MQQTQEIPLNFALPRLYKIKKVVTLNTFLILFGVSLQRNSIFFKHFTEVLKVLILYCFIFRVIFNIIAVSVIIFMQCCPPLPATLCQFRAENVCNAFSKVFKDYRF